MLMPVNNKPVSYLQTDSRWSSWPYSTSAENGSIGKSGCGPTSMAMVIATWVDPSVTPVTTAKWALERGYKATNNGTYHSYFVPQAQAYGLQCERINTSSILYMTAAQKEACHKKAHDAVDDGYLVVALMGAGNWTTGGHFILWYSNDGNDVLINDPASTKATRVRNTFALLKESARYYWAIKPPEGVISMTNTEVQKLVKTEVASAIATLTNPSSKTPSAAFLQYWYAACQRGLMDGSKPGGVVTRQQLSKILSSAGLYDPVEVPAGFDFEKDTIPKL